MAAMRDGSGTCYSHNPGLMRARSQARSLGGKVHAEKLRATKEAAQQSAPVAPASVPFALPKQLDSIEAVAVALGEAAAAVAAGTLDPQRGRLVLTMLRDARDTLAKADSGKDHGDSEMPADARQATPAELDFIIRTDGHLPPGVSWAQRPTILVTGPEWRGDPDRREDHRGAVVLPFPGGAT